MWMFVGGSGYLIVSLGYPATIVNSIVFWDVNRTEDTKSNIGWYSKCIPKDITDSSCHSFPAGVFLCTIFVLAFGVNLIGCYYRIFASE